MNQFVTGLILAGGQSRRMGTDKGLLEYKGKTLVVRALSTLAPLCNEILISTSNRDYDQFGYRLVGDLIKGAGPAAGILSGLQVASNPVVVVLSVDTPNLTTAFLSHLISMSGSCEAVVPRHDNGFVEPLCAVYKKEAIPHITQALNSGIYKLTDILCQLRVCYYSITPAQGSGNYFHNINTKNDLDQ